MKRVYIYGEREKYRDYIEALEAAGSRAIVSPTPEDADSCDGLLIPGGADLDPTLYGAENKGSVNIDRELDKAELALVRRFHELGRPILGICRGAQLLNVAFGGDLIQDLPTAAAHRWEEPTGDNRHMVVVPQGSFLYELYGRIFPVNSVHHQGIDRIAEGFRVAARATDGVIEALEWPERRIYALQWHPERMALHLKRKDTVDGLVVFKFFLGVL